MPTFKARGEGYPVEQQKGNGAAVLDAELSKLGRDRRGRETKEMTVAEASHLFGGRSVQKEGACRRSLRPAVYPEEGPSRRKAHPRLS